MEDLLEPVITYKIGLSIEKIYLIYLSDCQNIRLLYPGYSFKPLMVMAKTLCFTFYYCHYTQDIPLNP